MDVTLGLGSAIGAGVSALTEGSRHKKQKEYMKLAHENVKEQMKLQQEQQLDLWNKTNYEAQVKHMKEAGLNPALMYGLGGGGGAQSAGTGGSAGTPTAPTMDISGDIGNMAQISLLKSQKENIDADTEKKKAEAGVTSKELETLTPEAINAIADSYILEAGSRREEIRRAQLANDFEEWLQSPDFDEDGKKLQSVKEREARVKVNEGIATVSKLYQDVQESLKRSGEIESRENLNKQLYDQLNKTNPVELEQMQADLETTLKELEILVKDPANSKIGRYINFTTGQLGNVLNGIQRVRKVGK